MRYDVALQGDTVAFADLAWIHPTVPQEGGGRTALTIRNDPRNLAVMEYALTDLDARALRSRMRGRMTYGVGGPVLRVTDVDLDLQPAHTDFLRWLNGEPFPYDWRGALTGRVAGRGGPITDWQLDEARLTYADEHVPGARTSGTARGRVNLYTPAEAILAGMDVAIAQLDLRTPRFTPLADGQPLAPASRVRNSASSSRAGAVGAGWVSVSGHAGVSLDRMDHDYGVTVEPDVTIRLLRERAAFAGEWRALPGPLASVSLKASRTRYAHEEVEGSGEVGTRFASKGDEWRAELRHRPLAGLEGVLGLQGERLDFSALGEEAFVPGTATRSHAVFLLEEFRLGSATFSAGLRRERVTVSSDGDAPDAEEPRFGQPRSRRFSPGSASLAVRLDLGGGWQASGSLGRTERAPAYHELYANGLHLATAAYEVGDPDLGTERSRHVEFGLAFRGGSGRVAVNVFTTRFARYIALRDTGNVVAIPAEEPGEPATEVPEYRFEGVRARLSGAEIEAATTLAPAGVPLRLSATLDLVRGDDLDRREPLPRLPPLRLRVGVAWTLGGTTMGTDLRHAARQGRVPAIDTATPAATVLDLWARGRFEAVPGLSWHARLGNATDELAFNAAAVASVRGLSPAAGRSLAAGVQWRW
ncbi:MAG: hypothetical protein RLZZ341_2064 [Pseudomonadota bacterium]